MARLKVFSWSNGFHRFTVAASSRPKALEAWGLSQDIFQTGLASEIQDSPDAALALATPGQVVQRDEAIDLAEIGAPTKARPASRAKLVARAQQEPSGPFKADVKRVEALEAALKALDAANAAELADLEARRQTVVERAQEARDAHRKAHAQLARQLAAARARL